MYMHEVIGIAREISDNPRFIVPRTKLIRSYGNDVDVSEEQTLRQLPDPSVLDHFKVAAILPQLRKMAEEKSGYKIKVRNLDVPKRIPVYGYVEVKNDKSAIIRINGGLNHCWKRFTVAKELIHIYANICLDKSLPSASDMILAAQDVRHVIPNESVNLNDETAAFYIALEIMFPWCLRDQYHQLRKQRATVFQIAKAFMLPQYFVSHFCNDWSPYSELSNKLNLDR